MPTNSTEVAGVTSSAAAKAPTALFGDAGNDVLVGGPGSDYLDGGLGADLIWAIDGFVDFIKADDDDNVFNDEDDVFV